MNRIKSSLVLSLFLTLALVLQYFSSDAIAFSGVQSCDRVGWFQEGTTCDKNSDNHCHLEDQTYDMNNVEMFNLRHYTREGHKLENFRHIYNQQGHTGLATLDAICGGDTTGGANIGEWATDDYAGVCWEEHELFSPSRNCSNEILGRTYDRTLPNIASSRIDRCPSGCCSIEEYSAEADLRAITGATGDPMMAMHDDLQAFHQYKDHGCNELHWLDRKESNNGPDLPLMIPSGCQAQQGEPGEYKKFIDSQKALTKSGGGEAVGVEIACYAGNLTICPARPTLPIVPTDTGCGAARGVYGSSYSTGADIVSSWEHPHGTEWDHEYEDCDGGSCIPEYEPCEKCVTDGEGVKTCFDTVCVVDPCATCVPVYKNQAVFWRSCTCGTENENTRPPPVCPQECTP